MYIILSDCLFIFQSVEPYPQEDPSYGVTDGTLQFYQAITQLSTEIVRDLSEAVVLPFDIELYASSFKAALTNLQKPYNHLLQANGISIRNHSQNSNSKSWLNQLPSMN